jgi:Family of unknown function (DUF6776)
MIVRSHLPWPLRWAVAAVVLGFSAAIALWAFELGKDLAGLERGTKEELTRLRVQVQQLQAEMQQLRGDAEQARSVANTAESLLRTERAAQERLAQQLRQLEAEKSALQADLGFFERLLPARGDALQLRGLMAEPAAPGRLRYQLLVMQTGRGVAEFTGRYDVLLTGQLDGKPWSQAMPGGAQPLQVKQYARLDGVIEYPPAAVIKGVQARVTDAQGATRATQAVKL